MTNKDQQEHRSIDISSLHNCSGGQYIISCRSPTVFRHNVAISRSVIIISCTLSCPHSFFDFFSYILTTICHTLLILIPCSIVYFPRISSLASSEGGFTIVVTKIVLPSGRTSHNTGVLPEHFSKGVVRLGC